MSLTTLVRNASQQITYKKIIEECFDNIDIMADKTTKTILFDESIEFINELHSINPSMNGVFIDYLIRRIISEILENKFIDNRSECWSDRNHICRPRAEYKNIVELKEICKKRNISLYNEDHMRDLLEKSECKYNALDISLPDCQHLCYIKTKDTVNYKTAAIITDIFITSLFHFEHFGNLPQQEHIDEMYKKLLNKQNIDNVLIAPLINMCSKLISNKNSILLNPAFGGRLDGVKISIPSDADLVIDDNLIDIKCAKWPRPTLDIMQLLGYSSLIMLNEKYRKKINIVSIMNLISGTITSYNIEFVNKEHCIKYINLLNTFNK